MKVTFRQSGGFAGLVRGCEVDAAALPAPERDELRGMLDASGLEGMKSAPPPGARDLVGYELRVETGDGEWTATFDETSVPPAAEALLDYLRRRSGPRPPE